MNYGEVVDFNAKLAAKIADEQAAAQAIEETALPPAEQPPGTAAAPAQLPPHPTGITDADLLDEIRAACARTARIEALPLWQRWPAQLADTLNLRWGAAR